MPPRVGQVCGCSGSHGARAELQMDNHTTEECGRPGRRLTRFDDVEQTPNDLLSLRIACHIRAECIHRNAHKSDAIRSENRDMDRQPWQLPSPTVTTMAIAIYSDEPTSLALLPSPRPPLYRRGWWILDPATRMPLHAEKDITS